MKTVGVIQPNYLPWRGYFDFIHEVDVFVFLDDVQYTPRDWRNRNRILVANGNPMWLTVPVAGGRNQLIKDVAIDYSQKWQQKHLRAISSNYTRAPHFDACFALVEPLLMTNFDYLSDLDVALTKEIAGSLGISTEFVTSSDLGTTGAKDDKLLEIVKRVGGDCYLSGPSAKAYIDDQLWEQAGVELRYKDYSGYPVYPQIQAEFEPHVSILDLMFMVGNEAPDYIWGDKRNR